MPGAYLVRLTVGTEEVTRPIVIEEDPRVDLSSSERRAHFNTVMRLYNMTRAQDETRRALAGLRAQLASIKESAAYKQADAKGKEPVAAVEKRLEDLNARLNPAQPRRSSMVEMAERSPESVPDEQPQRPDPPAPARVIGTRAALLMNAVESITEVPSRGIQDEINTLSRDLKQAIAEVNQLSQRELPALAVKFRPSTAVSRQLPPRVEARW
jgi:hypothetical protein